jgi:hypothetical protein
VGEDDERMGSNAHRAPASQSLSDAPAACDATHLENFWSRGSKWIGGTSHLEAMNEGAGRGHFSVCSSNRAFSKGTDSSRKSFHQRFEERGLRPSCMGRKGLHVRKE